VGALTLEHLLDVDDRTRHLKRISELRLSMLELVMDEAATIFFGKGHDVFDSVFVEDCTGRAKQGYEGVEWD
jgi:hypothetical protein